MADLRQALITQAPSLGLHRAAHAEIAALDARIDELCTQLHRERQMNEAWLALYHAANNWRASLDTDPELPEDDAWRKREAELAALHNQAEAYVRKLCL